MNKTFIPWEELSDSDKEHHREIYNRQDEIGLNFFFLHLYPDIFDSIYRKLKDPAESEDIAQQCLIDVWYSKGRPVFANADELRKYHFGAARNACITHLKKHGKYKPEDFDDEMPDGSLGHPFQRTEHKELYNLVLKEILQFPEPKRTIVLANSSGWKNKDISKELNLPEKYIGNVLSRFRKWLRKRLPGYR